MNKITMKIIFILLFRWLRVYSDLVDSGEVFTDHTHGTDPVPIDALFFRTRLLLAVRYTVKEIYFIHTHMM